MGLLTRTRLGQLGAIAAMVVGLSCGDSVEDQIERLGAGGSEAEEAKMALSLARQDAIEPLLAAFEERRRSAEARSNMADALCGLYLREKDPRILAALSAATGDDQAPVRRSAVRCLGDLGGVKGSGPLIDRLQTETDDDVRRELLTGLGLMSLSDQPRTGPSLGRHWTPTGLEADKREQLKAALVRLRQEAVSDSLREVVLEWLECFAEEEVAQAQTLQLAADIAGAEALLLQARSLVPDSKNVNQRLGKLYFDNGQADKGLQILFDIGAALRVPRLAQAPRVDGALDDAGWAEAARVDRFYQNISRMRAFPVAGRSQMLIGWRDDVLFIGVRGDEATTDNLEAKSTARDQNAWTDDCVEVFFDPDRDGRTYWQFVVNSINTLFDQHSDGARPQGDISWNGQIEHATRVAADHWTLELAVPMKQFGEGQVGRGAVWGANLARIRIANASEYGQWVPTYGSALEPDRFGFLVFD